MAKAPIPRPPNWNRIRKQVLERDNHTCQSCGSKPKSPHIHHIIPRDKGGNEELKNLITKCLGCHISEEYAEKERIKMSRVALTTIMIAAIGLIIISAPTIAEASFSVIMRVKDVNSNSPTVKATVKTDTGLKISRTVDLGDKANKADLDMVDLHFHFNSDSKTKIGTGFKACLDSQCKSGTNGPAHKPEVVTFTAKKVN